MEYTKDQLGKWWCLLNARIMPKDFPFKHMSIHEAWDWISERFTWSQASPYWQEFIKKKKK